MEQKVSTKPAEDFSGNIILNKYFLSQHNECNANITENFSMLNENGSDIRENSDRNSGNGELWNYKNYVGN